MTKIISWNRTRYSIHIYATGKTIPISSTWKTMF